MIFLEVLGSIYIVPVIIVVYLLFDLTIDTKKQFWLNMIPLFFGYTVCCYFLETLIENYKNLD